MTWGNWYWPIWLIVVLLSFLPMEIFALFTNHKNTLSDWIWVHLRITATTTVGQWTAADLLTFLAYVSIFILWLPWHFWFHRFT